ncbi:hypothetical protein ACVWW1_007575 [Bradyrhizobium sp. JR3.5]
MRQLFLHEKIGIFMLDTVFKALELGQSGRELFA